MAYREDSQAVNREPGTKRKKLAGYLKAANELRQSYTASFTQSRDFANENDGNPGNFGVDVVRSGDEEMIIFPSYATHHKKVKPQAHPGTIQQVSGTGRDYRDTVGAGDAEFWKTQWEQYEDDKAIVDVDVRGWLYTPHKGQMSRKHRLMVGLARQLVGIPAPSGKSSPATSRPSSRPGSRPSSRSTSPAPGGHSKSPSRQEEELVQLQAEEIMRRGETEARIAGRGGFSELPSKESDGNSIYSPQSRSSSPAPGSGTRSRDGLNFDDSLAPSRSNTADSEFLDPVRKRNSWPNPAKMTSSELLTANNHLMTRLRPFMANPLANVSISAFFYNDKVSRQRTVTTNSAGQFTLRAALDFVPTHVRVLASEKLSATEPVYVTPSRGVSMISDIDDTIKHSAISSGAREIFRNCFIRELGDLTIEGVREWYTKLDGMGVKIHYVSNSPWQLYPVLTGFFKLAGLPSGSFHLKQYSGMLQGIFEPVAERKKATLEKIFRDFPERKFVLVGDSGEADLEVYTDTVLEHPGRVLAIFIRDVTTPNNKGFFDPSIGNLTTDKTSKAHMRNMSTDSLTATRRFNRPGDIQDDEEELRKAVVASLTDMEAEAAHDRRSIFGGEVVPTKFPAPEKNEMRPPLPPRRPTDPPAPQASAIEDDLIDFSDDETVSPGALPYRSNSNNTPQGGPLTRTQTRSPIEKRSTPPPPPKPLALRSPSSEGTLFNKTSTAKSPPPLPPKPRKPSTTVNTSITPSPLSQVIGPTASPNTTLPPSLPTRPINRTAALKRLSPTSAYFTREKKPPTHNSPEDMTAPFRTNTSASLEPPPPLRPSHPRRNQSAYDTHLSPSAPKTNNRLSGAWGESDYDAQAVPALGKKEELWKRRWAKAKSLLEERGVVLRTWRVGSDVEDICAGVVEGELRRVERESSGLRKVDQGRKTGEWDRKVDGGGGNGNGNGKGSRQASLK